MRPLLLTVSSVSTVFAILVFVVFGALRVLIEMQSLKDAKKSVTVAMASIVIKDNISQKTVTLKQDAFHH